MNYLSTSPTKHSVGGPNADTCQDDCFGLEQHGAEESKEDLCNVSLEIVRDIFIHDALLHNGA